MNHVTFLRLSFFALLVLFDQKLTFDGRALFGCCQMRLKPEEFEPRLKKSLECFRCDLIANNMPALKRHLQEEFNDLRKRGVAAGKSKKRRREVVDEEAESTSDCSTPAITKVTKNRKREVVDADIESTSDRKDKGKKVTRVS